MLNTTSRTNTSISSNGEEPCVLDCYKF
uniref:Uncharacterized protein n=1 Tax=Rhizophora mucronata TaxID=61149 RepID=A0A2P2PZ11_RHIMU